MENTRYFRSSNQLNVTVNLLSGNLFPLGYGHRSLSFVAILWIICIWWVRITYFWSWLLGSFCFTKQTPEEMFKRTGVLLILTVESLSSMLYLQIRRKALNKLISEYNLTLIDSEQLKRYVLDSLRPYVRVLKVYMFVCFGATSAWAVEPIFKIFTNDRFTYEDFTIPSYLPGEPFGKNMFIAGVVLHVLGCCSIHFTKISVDFYIIHFIAVLTAQYKFVGEQLRQVLSAENSEKDELSVIAALHQCVRYHAATIQIGRGLSKVLALYIGGTYLTCILKFCFLAFGVITFAGANIAGVAYFVHVLACIVQVFLLCSSIHNLLIESTSVTRDAFHENWYARSCTVKQIFCTIEMTNQMECRLSAWRIVDLVVPTLASILSKSYSVCLLLLKVK